LSALQKFCIAALAVLVSQSSFGGQPTQQTLPSDIDRLIAIGKLWVTVKYFHPYLAYRDIDWDKALVNSLPRIRSAQTQAEYAAAVQSMLDVLKDPVTRVSPEAADPAGDVPEAAVAAQRIWVHNGLAPAVRKSNGEFYSAFYLKPGAKTETAGIPLGGSIRATVRLSEPASSPGPAYPQPWPDLSYAENAYPAAEYRILAVYKIWGVFHYFFAYRDLMDEDWDDLFPTFLPKFIAAKDAREYNLTIAEMLTHAADSHASVDSEALSEYFGKAPVGLRLRVIEKHAVVTSIVDPEARKEGVNVGDIVKSVDGETLIDRFQRQAQYVAASTPQSLGESIMRRILNGPEGSSAILAIEDRAGNRKEVRLKRSAALSDALKNERAGEAIKLLPGNIGYADLNRLKRVDVDGMFEKFRKTTAIVFDMRGEPLEDTVDEIAPRLTDQRDVPAAIVTGPLTLKPDLQQGGLAAQSASYFFVETLPNSEKWKYKGKTVMLIDERTMSGAEHAGLFLEVANKTSFIGTPSAGADGVITDFVVPGGVTISFSGQDVRHANGGKLQRLGLQPAVLAFATNEGIRKGKDEVLDKAVAFLAPAVVPPPNRSLRSSAHSTPLNPLPAL
jgi:C-terminal processing protease CtpA/Prc